MKHIHVDSRVRVADTAILEAALHGSANPRPEPAQMLWAGRIAIVTTCRRRPGERTIFVLRNAPGFWLEEWIDPLDAEGQ